MEGSATSTTSVRIDPDTGESIISFGDAEVLGPPLRLEEAAVLGTQVERAQELPAPALLARTGDELVPLAGFGALLVLVGVVLAKRAPLDAPPPDPRPRTELSIRWVASRPRHDPSQASGGLTLRFL